VNVSVAYVVTAYNRFRLGEAQAATRSIGPWHVGEYAHA
jgi:hypothetical protein